MSDHLNFVFIEPGQSYSHHAGAVVVQNVKDMVARVLFELAQSGGKIGRITFESHASWSGPIQGYFYIGLDEINYQTIKQHADDLIKLSPHFAPDAQITIYGRCGSSFNVMTTYMLWNYWPGVSVSTKNSTMCAPYSGQRYRGHYHGNGSHNSSRHSHGHSGRYGHGQPYRLRAHGHSH